MILAGDHVYKMDYKYMLEDHLNHQADVTIACMEVPRILARNFGVAEVDGEDRIQSWVEKSVHPPCIPGKPNQALASMGIYLFKSQFLFDVLERDALDPGSTHDFGMDVIPSLLAQARVYAHRFERSCIQNPTRPGAYWRDVGTVDAYWEANLDLTSANPMLNLYEEAWPIHTHMDSLPPAKFIDDDPTHQGVAANSLVSPGCVMSGADIHRSILFSKVRVCRHALLDEAVVLPGAVIGEGARLRRVVIAPGCQTPSRLIVGDDPVSDARRFFRSPGGVTLITKPMIERL
jgi:glucose-1-phosphate adenylyltransferase